MEQELILSEEIHKKVILMSEAELKKEYEDLKEKATKGKDLYNLHMFAVLTRAYEVGKKIYGQHFSLNKLAEDFGVTRFYIKRVFSLKKANPKTRQLIKEGKISVTKVMEIICKEGATFQDEIVEQVVNNNLKISDIKRLRSFKSLDEHREFQRLKAIETGYSERWAAARGFERAATSIRDALLIHPEELPRKRIDDVRGLLKSINDEIEEYLSKFDDRIKSIPTCKCGNFLDGKNHSGLCYKCSAGTKCKKSTKKEADIQTSANAETQKSQDQSTVGVAS